MHWIYIFLGGGLGSILRYSLSVIPIFSMPVSHPIRTLLANAIASLLLGFITYISFTAFDLPDTVKLGLTVGFCGGLSTFSTFSAESIQLLQEGTLLSFFLYAFGTMAICLFAFLMGVKLAGA